MIENILICYILQIAFTVGIITLFGLLIAICNKRFYANLGGYGKAVCYITGAVGTPLHECAHALFCLIFGHKITKIKFFQINSADGTLGYVQHAYNSKNIYQKVGNFFIGIAPIVVISAVLYLLAHVLLPGFAVGINKTLGNIRLVGNFEGVLSGFFNILKSFFLCAGAWQWWIFIFASTLLSLHMTLSKEDIKGALSGLILLLVAVLVADIIMGLIKTGLLLSFTRLVLQASSYLVCIFFVAFLTSIIDVIISYFFYLIKRRIRI